MKWTITLLLGAILIGCGSEENLNSQWQITWQVDEISATGRLILDDDNTGRLIIDKEQPPIIAITDDFSFSWYETDDKLTFIRKDNDFKLQYDIVEKTDYSYQLLFADEISVKINRIAKAQPVSY